MAPFHATNHGQVSRSIAALYIYIYIYIYVYVFKHLAPEQHDFEEFLVCLI
jgi:hypothetical protein